jgi:hypothetical protein
MVHDSFKNRELLNKIKKRYKDNNVQWTFDTAQNAKQSEQSGRSEIRADRSTSVTSGHQTQAYQIDDDDSGRDYYANTAFHMAQITTPKGDTLLDRWIVDPGSNVHICNSTYFNWHKTSDARSTNVIFAGATGYQVAAWGEVIISVNRGKEKKDLLLTHVAYVPGFLTNLFALGRCRHLGIHFDLERNILYKERISSVVASLAYSQGHWLLDAKEADRLPCHELLSMAVRSSQEKSQTVTAMRAHQLLGHLSYHVLEHLQNATTGLKIGTNGKGDP